MSNKRPQKKSKVSNSASKKATPKLRVNNQKSKAVNAPTARAAKTKNTGARIVAREGGGCTVSHSEMIGNLNSQAVNSFQLLKRLRVNPGSSATFPWLSRMAPNYEMFRFHKLHFRFETRSPTTLGGALIMSPEYDAADGTAGSDTEQSLYNNRGSVDDAVWKQIVLKLETSSLNKMYKSHVVMSDARFASTSQDAKTIDPAQVFIGTDCNNAASLGKLFVDYSVELMVPSAVTEVIGGGGSQEANNALFTNTNHGLIRKIPEKTGVDEIEPVADFISTLVSKGICTTPTDASPQFTVCKFNKDFQGVFSQMLKRTGLPWTSGATAYIMKPEIPNAANVEPSTINSVPQQIISSIGNGVIQSELWKISAQAGDFLKIRSNDLAGGIAELLDLEHTLASASLKSLVV